VSPAKASGRVPVQKTLKLYINGKFPRSESGRTLKSTSHRGEAMHVSHASRKDLRDTVEAARTALDAWGSLSAYNRGQILYRLAFPAPAAEVEAAIDRVVHHAGWTDKITALLSTLNPVASAYVNYSLIQPVGVVAAIPDPAEGLLGLVEAVCTALVMGDTVALLVPPENAERAVALAEAIAVSDVPAGVVNVLTTDLGELVAQAARHDDIDALYVAGNAVPAALFEDAERENARVMRRVMRVASAKDPATPVQMQKLAEVKTVWMSSGQDIRVSGKY
jgi:acyl-CoA reductase-like NAD-dependent aldehyde dehydrogenase